MSQLIATDYRAPTVDPFVPIKSIHMPKQVIKENPYRQPEPPQTLPPPVAPPTVDINPDRTTIPTLNPRPPIERETGPQEISRDPIPFYKPAPRYPAAALRRGVDGYVIVEFTITKTGGVRDPQVVGGYDSAGNPTEVFDRAALSAVARFKYQPQMVEGEPVERSGVRNRISFRIAE
jgi:protein TonB